MDFVYTCKIVNDNMTVLSRETESLDEVRKLLKSMITNIFSVDDIRDQAHFFSRRDIEFRIIDQLIDSIERDIEFDLQFVRYAHRLSKDYNEYRNWRIEIEVTDWENYQKSQLT